MGKIITSAKRHKWTPKEVQVLKDHYHSTSRAEISGMLPGIPVRSIECKAHCFGIRREKQAPMTATEVRESKRVAMAARRADNPELARQKQNEWFAKNRDRLCEKLRSYMRRRFFWARRQHLRGSNRASYKQLAALWHKQRGRCAMTGRRLTREIAELDHITPKARGGGDQIQNLRWVCKAVNRAKRDASDADFIALCADVVWRHAERPKKKQSKDSAQFEIPLQGK